MLIIQLSAFVMFIESLIEQAIWFRFLPQNLLRDSAERAKADHEISVGLPGFKHESDFVARRLPSDVDHIRFRTNSIVGPIDKLGLCPLLASILFTWWKLKKPTAPTVLDWILGGAIGYMLLYLLAAFGRWRLHRFEELAQMAELALEMKPGSDADAAVRPASI